jgi:hypothetical protein
MAYKGRAGLKSSGKIVGGDDSISSKQRHLKSEAASKSHDSAPATLVRISVSVRTHLLREVLK